MKRIVSWLCRMAAGIAVVCALTSGAALAAEAEMADGHVVSPCAEAAVPVRQVNVRSGPGSKHALLGSLEKGQAVNVCGKTDNGWYQVVYGTGIGYVSQKLVTPVPVDEGMRAAIAQQAAFVKAAIAQQEAAVRQEDGQEMEAALEAQEALAQQQEAALAAQEALAQQQEAALALAQQAAVPGGNVIFAGDSRTGQMGNAVGGSAAYPGVAFVACFGGGNEWLSGVQAKKDIDQFVGPGSVIVLNYGVNDLSKHNEYIATINRYARDWREKGAVVYFATVGPVGENEFGKRNWAVEYFNDQLSNRLDGSIGRIPLYSYLTMTGYTTTADGLHYTPDVYARMFQYLMQSIGKL